MRNERGAGRKKLISDELLQEVEERIAGGESVSAIAVQLGVSRQALYQRLQAAQEKKVVQLEYREEGRCISEIEVDVQKEKVLVRNFDARLSAYIFGICNAPGWKEFASLVMREYLKKAGVDENSYGRTFLCIDPIQYFFSLDEALREVNGLILVENEAGAQMPRFAFTKKELLSIRTDTDGYQMKAITPDRKWFVKAQAIIAGIRMEDWAVELIATKVCEQLGIACVKQSPCEFVYAGRKLRGVYAENFELIGYGFVSFESLLESMGHSSNEEEFIRMDAIGKLEWCARMLAQAGNLVYEDTHRYMVNLVLLDCLVGNVDRHTRNFGLFYDSYEGRYEIALAFDHGMGLFEHDDYRDRYENYESAMRNVYVAPYGEDPFDMLALLDEAYGIFDMYPALAQFHYDVDAPGSLWGYLTGHAREYARKIEAWLDTQRRSDGRG